jgi:AraC family transcriptional regulator
MLLPEKVEPMTSTPNQNLQDFVPILHARSKNYFWKGKGALSIKTFMNGRAYYHTGINKQRDGTWLEEKLHDLTQRLLQVHRQVNKEMMKLQSLKASTREELYKRLHVGHDFISAYFDQPLTLSDIARAACLSPNHFLRSYKQLFGMSPHQFLTEKRLQEAKKLLLRTEKSITDICLEVGFQSPSSFTGLFSKRFAMSPSQFRQKK